MRNVFVLGSLMIGLLVGGSAVGQEKQQKGSSNEAEIKALYDRWAKAFEAKDIDAIMAIYAPGDLVIAYDVVPPLQYKGKEAYRNDYLVWNASSSTTAQSTSNTGTCGSSVTAMWVSSMPSSGSLVS